MISTGSFFLTIAGAVVGVFALGYLSISAEFGRKSRKPGSTWSRSHQTWPK